MLKDTRKIFPAKPNLPGWHPVFLKLDRSSKGIPKTELEPWVHKHIGAEILISICRPNDVLVP